MRGTALAAQVGLAGAHAERVGLGLRARVLHGDLHLALLRDELVLEEPQLAVAPVRLPAQVLTVLEVEPLGRATHQLVGVASGHEVHERVRVRVEEQGLADLLHAVVVEVEHAALGVVQDRQPDEARRVEAHALARPALPVAEEAAVLVGVVHPGAMTGAPVLGHVRLPAVLVGVQHQGLALRLVFDRHAVEAHGAGLAGVLHALLRGGGPRARQGQEMLAHVGRLMIAVGAEHLREDHPEAVVAHEQRQRRDVVLLAQVREELLRVVDGRLADRREVDLVVHLRGHVHAQAEDVARRRVLVVVEELCSEELVQVRLDPLVVALR